MAFAKTEREWAERAARSAISFSDLAKPIGVTYDKKRSYLTFLSLTTLP
jgi:hypothetical protein